jgi:hypothetical protein
MRDDFVKITLLDVLLESNVCSRQSHALSLDRSFYESQCLTFTVSRRAKYMINVAMVVYPIMPFLDSSKHLRRCDRKYRLKVSSELPSCQSSHLNQSVGVSLSISIVGECDPVLGTYAINQKPVGVTRT